MSRQIEISDVSGLSNALESGFIASGWPVTPPTRRGATSVRESNSTITIPFPAGSEEGDLAIAWVGAGNNVIGADGWDLLTVRNQTAWNCGVFSKVLTSADIATGSVTFSLTGSFQNAAACITWVAGTWGGIFYLDQLGMDSTSVADSTTKGWRTPMLPVGADVIYGASTRDADVTVSDGSLLTRVSGDSGAMALWSKSPTDNRGIRFYLDYTAAQYMYYVLRLAVVGIASGPAGSVYGFGDSGLPLPASNFSAISGYSSTAEVTQVEDDTILFSALGGTGGQPAVALFRDLTASLTPPYSYTIRPSVDNILNNFQSGGLMLRDSVTGIFTPFYFQYNSYAGGLTMRVDKWTSPTASSALLNGVHPFPNYLRIREDGTNIFYEFSMSGKVWTTYYSTTRAEVGFTPDQIGVFVQPWYESGSSRNPKFTVRSIPSALPVAPPVHPWYWNPPKAVDFPNLSASTAPNPTLIDDPDAGLIFDGGAPVAGDEQRSAYLTLPSPTTPWRMTIVGRCYVDTTNYSGIGLIAWDSVGGRNYILEVKNGSDIVMQRFSGYGVYASGVSVFSSAGTRGAYWLRIEFTGSAYIFSFSQNGKSWYTVANLATAEYLTNPANRIGLNATYNRTTGVNNRMDIEYCEIIGGGL